LKLSRLWPFRRAPGTSSSEVASRVARWRAGPEFDRARMVASGRWVVVDVESGGLDTLRDALVSVGALGVTDGDVDLADSFEVVLRQQAPTTARNIEIHGIAGTEQLEGDEPAGALAGFLEFIGKDPLVAFHAPFDAAMLRRAIERQLQIPFRRPWLDLAHAAPLVWPKRARLPGLDEWLEALSIPVAFRHRAIIDCLATAQLLAMVLRHAPEIGASTAGTLIALSGGDRAA
jgi:DNA polymerase-3 subunit epsilon